MNKKVFVGMSGGVDSSVAAALLKEAGYNVTGVFIKIDLSETDTCTWRADRREAMRAAAHLRIPLLFIDLSAEYRERVVTYLLSEYSSGRTPNPDILCNREIKFGLFYDWAREQGADLVATGHYARVISGRLVSAVDSNKDQTYFLWNIRPECLNTVLFPIGHLSKPEVRALATKYGLPNATRKDSQGLCFVGQVNFKDFLKERLGVKPGLVLGEDGRVLGSHEGAILYTMGERHGFSVKQDGSSGKPYYVVGKDIDANTLTVSHSDQSRMIDKKVKLEKVNWLGPAGEVGEPYLARARYRQPLVPIKITELSLDTATVEFALVPDFIAPGQSLVIYDSQGDVCLGGGIIV